MSYKLLLLLFCVATAHAAEQPVTDKVSDEEFASMHQSLVDAEDDKAGCELVKKLLQTGVYVNRQLVYEAARQTLLHAAVNPNPKYETAKFLLESRADPNIFDADGHSPLHEAMEVTPCLDIVKLLLQSRADVHQVSWRLGGNLCKQSPLTLTLRSWLCSKPSAELIELLLESTTLGQCEPANRENPVVKNFFAKRAEREDYIQKNFLIPELAQLVIAYQRRV